jgi:alpha-beta hydrolase superfamily lysophospholipase
MAFLTFDLPGHGQSEGKRGVSSYAEIADEIDQLLVEASRRYPDKPVILYGHSLGGVTVLYYLVTRQPKIKAAIATSPGLSPGSPVPAFKVMLGRALNRLMPSITISSGLDAANISRDPQVVAKYRQDPLVHDQVCARLGWDILTSGESIISQAGNLQTPLLVTAGTGDHIVSMQAIQQFIECAPPDLVTVKLFEGGFHEPHNDLEHEEAIDTVVKYCLTAAAG